MKASVGRAVALCCAAAVPGAWAALLRARTGASPVSGVVEVLKDMRSQLEQEADRDSEVYEKLACWCENNDQGKTKAISDAESHLSDLGTTVEKMTALSSTLNVEIRGLEQEIAKNQASLSIAGALREKQRTGFTAEEKEMIQSIRALDAAIVVLSKHHGGLALLSGSAFAAIASAARTALQRHMALLQGTLTPQQRRMILSMLQEAPEGHGNAAPTVTRAYQAQSGEIFGILKEMKATFEADLSASQQEELEAQRSYESVKAAKEDEIQMGQASLRDKQQQLAAADERLTESKQDREDTTASLSADQQFLLELKQTCSTTDKEWEERQKARQAELAAVSQAISVLSTDDARDLFSRALKPMALVQTGSVGRPSGRERATSVLVAMAAKTQQPRLAALATSLRLDSFVQVKKAIDDMVAELEREKGLEIQHRDWCTEELHANELSAERQLHTKTALASKVEGLKLSIGGLESTIETLSSEVSDLELQKQRAKEDRDLQHQDFQATVAEQREAQGLLQQALDVLRSSYAAAGPQEASLAQQALARRSAAPTPPAGFGAYKANGAGPGVLAMLERVLESAKQMEAEAMRAETAAQDAFTRLSQQTTASVAAKEASIVDRTAEKSQAERDLLQAQSELDGTAAELESLSGTATALHSSCDFVLKNFELRQAARDEEVAALRQAKAYLSGMKT
mmetsp:Transcript_55342/g.177472  ORF Transcript_55342/g.177472 Transcript_55342/m.177472 type:complete len:689 (-) Transcript_55342:47-2113(-)